MTESMAGWHPDPYGRGRQRYWDGSRWTEFIAVDGRTVTDPLGTTATIPFTAPIGSTTGSTAGSATGSAAGPADAAAATATASVGFAQRLGPAARERPAPTLPGAFGAAGGVILTFGLLVLVLGDDIDATTGVLCGLALIGVACVGMWKSKPGDHDLRAVAIAGGAVGVATFAAAATSSNTGTTTFLLAGVLYMVAWFAPPFRGTPFCLGAGTLALVLGLAVAISESSSIPVSGGSSDDLSIFGDGLPGNWFAQSRNAGIFLLVAALGLSIIVRRIDIGGFRGISTPLLFTALVSAFVGVAALGATLDETGAYLVAAAAGAILAYVGARGGHRATTWFGSAMAGAAAIAAVLAATTPSNQRVGGALALVVGVLLVVAPRLAGRVRTASNSSNEEPTETGHQPLPPPSLP